MKITAKASLVRRHRMRIRRIHSSLLAVALAFMAAHTSHAEDVPRTADGKPELSGIYTQPSTVNATGPRGNLIFNADKMAPVKPGAESLLYHPRTGDARVDEPRAVCLPSGFPSGMLYILPIQIVQNSKYVVIIPELQRAARIIPTDGRPHREGIEPTYYGDSVGKWEGDTLVIDLCELQAVDPRRLPLYGSDEKPLAHRCPSHHRAPTARGKQASIPYHHRRPQNFHAAVVAGL